MLAPRMPTREDETASAVMLAEAADPEAWLDVHIAVDVELQSKRALLEGVTGASDDDRLARIETIEMEAEMLLAPVEAMVTAAGAKVLGRVWLGQPALAVQMPAREVRRVAELDGVLGLTIATPELEQTAVPTDYYPLDRVSDGHGLMTREFVHHGWEGNLQNRTNAAQPMRIAIMESESSNPAKYKPNWIDPSHPGWLDLPGGATRVKKIMKCWGGVCVDTNPIPGGNHGNGVASVAAGCIDQGQDPAFPGINTPDQIARTGPAPEAEIYYYNIQDSIPNLQAALQRAVTDGVDVVNMSFGNNECDPAKGGGANATIKDAADAGIVLVSGTGNDQDGDACGVSWPALRPEILAVGGTNTSVSATAFRDSSLTPAINEFGDPFSSFTFGGMPVVTRSGTAFSATVVSLVAPGWMRHPYTWNGPDGRYENGWGGSSLASPTVAGSAALLLEHFRDAGSASGFNSRRFMAHMMLLGDAWDGADVVAPGGTQYMPNGPNKKSGFGRLRMRGPYAPLTNLVGPYHWASNVVTAMPGQVYSFAVNGAGPEPAGPTEFKVVAHWTPTDFGSTSDIVLELWNTCPAGGGPAAKLQHNHTFDYRKRIRRTNISGQCLEVRVIPYSVPAQGEAVYLAYLYHSGEVSP
ncbi:S8/S53 family peptidase [Myxococcota bacterium]|nr:S8/S53 family peptidase [Myxococcota bacterium]